MNGKFDNNVLRLLENDFEGILYDLTTDKQFNEFKSHYQKMLDSLKHSH